MARAEPTKLPPPLRIDRHSSEECEVAGCHGPQEVETYLGREAHRVDLCSYHTYLIRDCKVAVEGA